MKFSVIWLAILLTASINTTLAQTYPVKPIRLIVPYVPGGAADIGARLIAPKLGESLGGIVIVENRGGAAGNTGTHAMAKAAPDGYTIGMATPAPVTIGRSLYPSLPYDPEKDLVPIIFAYESPIVLVTHPSVPARTAKELVALAKVRPNFFNAAYPTTASPQHLLTEMFKRAAGIEVYGIAYQSGAIAATDLVGGHVDIGWAVVAIVLPFINAGRLRALAVASEKRSAFLPHVSTMGELGWPSILGSVWGGVVAPTGIPKEIIDRLNAEIGRILKAPDIKKRFAAAGLTTIGGTPGEFSNYLRADAAKWAEIIRTANIKVD